MFTLPPNKRIFALLILGLFCCLPGRADVIAPSGKEESPKLFCWEIRSSVSRVTLLGSIHFASADIYPLNESIQTAFNESKVLVVEANINNARATESLPTLLKQAFYESGDGLPRHLSQATYRLARERYESNQLPMLAFDQQKPWFLAASLLSVELKKLDVTPELGIDKHFLERAEGRKVVELESIQDQLNIFNNLTDREQELYLHTTLQDLKTLPENVRTMVQAWKTGDVKTIEQYLTRHLESTPHIKPLHYKLITLRNLNMLTQIEGFLRTKQNFFVIVGAGHLVGDHGILKLLENRNQYFIRQLTANSKVSHQP